MDAEEKNSRRRFGQKRIILISIIAVFIAGGGGEAFVLYRQAHQSSIPIGVRSQVSFTLYYPSPLPAGWAIDTTSYTVNDGIVFYKLQGPTASIVVNIQPRPASLDVSDFYKQQMKDVVLFDTKSGDGAIGTAGARLVGSMLGKDSWALLSPTSSNITQHELRQIITALHS